MASDGPRHISEILPGVAADILAKADARGDVEEGKRECLARWVLDHFTTKAARQEWLALFEKKNGPRMTADLKARMTRIYRARLEETNNA